MKAVLYFRSCWCLGHTQPDISTRSSSRFWFDLLPEMLEDAFPGVYSLNEEHSLMRNQGTLFSLSPNWSTFFGQPGPVTFSPLLPEVPLEIFTEIIHFPFSLQHRLTLACVKCKRPQDGSLTSLGKVFLILLHLVTTGN